MEHDFIFMRIHWQTEAEYCARMARQWVGRDNELAIIWQQSAATYAIIGRLEALQNETKDAAAKDRMQAAKSELMYLLRSER